MANLQSIPTNIITGFLGVGKTTTILHLLQHKPQSERWAILVNEFGEIGIDQRLIEGSKPVDKHHRVFIREVPGGCMCCTAGLPMQVALTQLLHESRPDRLLIEPTGLGHPKEVLSTLRADHYRDVLDIQKTLALVDARKTRDSQYTQHPIFRQQLEIADVIVANKSDQYDASDFPALERFLLELESPDNKPIHQTTMGKIQFDWLSGSTNTEIDSSHHATTHSAHTSAVDNDPPLPDCGYLTVTNKGEGFHSQGWIFRSDFLFCHQTLSNFFLDASVTRLKGIFNTTQGAFSYNKTDGVLTEMAIQDITQSRVELIAETTEAFPLFEQTLLSSIVNN